MELELSARSRGGCAVVEARGECDLNSAPILRELLLCLLGW